MKKIFAGVMALTILLSVHQSFAQNGTRLIGFDAKTTARGGTATGFFDNPSLMMNNPAGLSFLRSDQFDVSFSGMLPSVHFKNGLNNSDGKNNFFPLGCISYGFHPSPRVAYAFGVFTQGGMGADFNLNHGLFRDQSANFVPQIYHSKFAVMQAGASVAYKITNQLSIGATANVVYGQVEFQMPMAMSPSMLRGVIDPIKGLTFGDMFSADPEAGGLGYSELVATAKLTGLAAYGFNAKIGLAFQPSDKFSAGLNYSSPVAMSYNNGSADMDMSGQMNDAFGKVVGGIMQQDPTITSEQAQQMALDQFAQLGIHMSAGARDNYDARAEFGLPQSVSAGLSFSASKKLRIALDGEWINWANAFDKMDISLRNGTNTNINRMTGAEGNLQMAFPLNWKNTIVIRTGGELQVSKIVSIAAGYVYGSNPVPHATIFPVFPAVVVHHVTAGATAKLWPHAALNFGYEYAFRNNETADSKSLIGSEYDNSVSGLSNSIFHLSFSMMFR
jgi:long-chain fatty acid transport protein